MGKKQHADAALVERARKGDRRAFDALVIKYQQKIVQLVSRYVSNNSDALDVSQEAFIKAYRAIGSFRGDSAFYTWLYRIAINTAKNHLTARNRRPVESGLDLQDPEQYAIQSKVSHLDTPEGLVLTDEIKHTVNQALADLPEDLRTAIVLRELQGMSYDEISEAMECPVGTVRSRIFRAREAISGKLQPLLQ